MGYFVVCWRVRARACTERCVATEGTDEVASDGELLPLPETTWFRLEQPNCFPNDPDALMAWRLTCCGHVHWKTDHLLARKDKRSGRSRDAEYEGKVEQLDHPLPAGLAEELSLHEISEDTSAYRSARLTVGGETARLVARTRSLGLREGMEFEAFQSSRPNIFVSSDRQLTIRSHDETMFHYHLGAFHEELPFPDELRVEREDRLCHLQTLGGGDVYSLRITNRDGESIVLAPGQARSLGDFDIYLWMALYPVEGQTTLSGIDSPTAVNEIAIVRRVVH